MCVFFLIVSMVTGENYLTDVYNPETENEVDCEDDGR